MDNWKKTILKSSSSLKEAMEVLQKVQLKIVLVLDHEQKLQGVVTDGDVRRALVSGKNMETKISDIMIKEPTVAFEGENRISILEKIDSSDISSLPVLDHQGRVVNIETRHKLLQKEPKKNTVVLMVGGEGRRLRPLTNKTPKPLLNVGSKPLLERILIQFSNSGFRNFYLSIFYKSTMIKDYFGKGEKWDLNIKYLEEDKPLGTAGALGLLPESSNGLPLILMNGDLLTSLNFSHLLEFHESSSSLATICVSEYEDQVPYGVVNIKNSRVESIVEKPSNKYFINAGIYVLNPEVIKLIKRNEYLDMPDLLKELVKKKEKINTFYLKEYWLDIGRKDDYEKANEEVME